MKLSAGYQSGKGFLRAHRLYDGKVPAMCCYKSGPHFLRTSGNSAASAMQNVNFRAPYILAKSAVIRVNFLKNKLFENRSSK